MGRGIVLNLTAECGIKSRKSHVTDVTRRTANLTGRDNTLSGGYGGIEPKIVPGCGIKRRLLDNTQQYYRVTKTSQASLWTGQEWREGRLIVDKYRKRQRWNFSPSLGPVHTMRGKFDNGGFTLKSHQMFLSTLRRRNVKTQSSVIWDLCLRKT